SKVMTSSSTFDSPWKVFPNLDSSEKRQAYGILYYTLIDRNPLKENFNGSGDQYRIETAHSPELMMYRKNNLKKVMGEINFDYFDSAEKVSALVKSIEEFKSPDELVFHLKSISQGSDSESLSRTIKAKLRRYGLTSELSHKYVLLPIEVEEANIQGPSLRPYKFVDIVNGNFRNPWTIEMDNIGGYEPKEKAKFFINDTKDFFDSYVDSFSNDFQLQAFGNFLDKLSNTEVKLSTYRSGELKTKLTDYIFHEVSTPIEKVKSNWLTNLAITRKSSNVIFPFRYLAQTSDQTFRLIYFERRVIQSISSQEDLAAYLKLTKLFGIDKNMDKINRLWNFLNDNKEANPRHLVHIMDKWDDFAKAEKIELSKETLADLSKILPPPSSKAAEMPGVQKVLVPEIKSKPNTCLDYLKAFIKLGN
ncbi:MAG: hypothetical protein K2Q18_04705, partial [Bdellovibrionales bacterium]|nr:hypothetical protein [Bdellovibrionales bacterium]